MGTDSLFLVVSGDDGQPTAAFGIDRFASRALPRHFIWRVERLTCRASDSARDAAFDALVDRARYDGRVLRLIVELFDRDRASRERNARALAARGFQRREVPRCYAETIAIDLERPLETIFASLDGSTRRKIRAVKKRGLEVRPIDNARYAPRLTELLGETMARTGGAAQDIDWISLLEFTRREPSLARLIGLFDPTHDGERSLLAFVWGCNHGEYVNYEMAASTRRTTVHAPFTYALAWDLIEWAHRSGARWFDFGGITSGHFGGNDPLGGISDFKRFFGNTVVAVGEDWSWEPNRVRGAVARAIGVSASFLSRVLRVT